MSSQAFRVFFSLLILSLMGSIAQAQSTRLNLQPNLFLGWSETIFSPLPSSGNFPNIQNSNTETEITEPILACRSAGVDRGTYSVWMRVNHPGGTLSVSTVGSNYDTVLAVFEATQLRENLAAAVACNDDIGSGNLQSQIIQTLPSNSYLILVVWSGSGVPAGSLTLNIALNYVPDKPAPSNDSIGGATVLQANKITKTINAQFATDDAMESALTACPINSGVWYEYSSYQYNIIRVSLAGSWIFLAPNAGASVAGMAIYTSSDNTPTGALTLQACQDATYAVISEDIGLAPGQKAYIHVGLPTIKDRNPLIGTAYQVKVGAVLQQLMVNPNMADGFTGWTTKNTDASDMVVGGMMTINAGAKTKTITQVVHFPTVVKSGPNNYIAVQNFYKSSVPGAKFTLTITYKDETPPQKWVINFVSNDVLQAVANSIAPNSKAIASVKAQWTIPAGDTGYVKVYGLVVAYVRPVYLRDTPVMTLPFPMQ